MKSPTKNKILKFLEESNKIEGVYGQAALDDAYEAWRFLAAQDGLTLINIRYTHALLARFIWSDIAGFWRRENVRVGNQVCPNWQDIVNLMGSWLKKWKNAKTEKTIITAHVVFERIHPFRDFNGRVGRIIMNWQRVKNNLPIMIIHEGKEQLEYYSWFK